MLIQWLCDLLYRIWNTIFGWVEIPQFSETLLNDINSYIDMILLTGRGIVSFFIPTTVFDILLGIVIAIITIKYTYFVVMWIIKKIPVVAMQ